jgi:chromate transport protein ChrA
MFALCQALPGPGSTKMIYAINLIHGGALAGIFSFFIWRCVTLSYDIHPLN